MSRPMDYLKEPMGYPLYPYETWKEQGKPTCNICYRPVLPGYLHYCDVTAEMKIVPEPKDWPL